MMVASPETNHLNNSNRVVSKTQEEEMCDKLIQLSFAKIVNSKSERGGAKLHKNLLILHLLQKARWEQRNRRFYASMSMDTTNHVSSNYQTTQEVDINDEDSGCSLGNTDEQEQMQTDGHSRRGYEIEIDETSSQQQAIASINENDGDEEDESGDAGTFSAPNVHLASSCLSLLAPSVSHESGFDSNHDSRTTITQQSPPIFQTWQQASSQQSIDLVIDVKHTANVELGNTNGHVKTAKETGEDEKPLGRHHRHRCSQSCSSKRKYSSAYSSSSSSSSDSDDSSNSSEESYTGMDGQDEKKSRDCLKRKLDDSNSNAGEKSSLSTDYSEWYSSPKMACIVHTQSETSNSPQQNLNGLISVLQSAALTSDEPAKVVSPQQEEEQLNMAVSMFDPESSDSSSQLQRSLSCPGLVELICES